ncbi:glutathione peroxidase [Tomitella biformata]|uniref:glutathione peroxidase n=1 Tax=Tomitella biformata TaxID=630403 RepID=UPI00068751A6
MVGDTDAAVCADDNCAVPTAVQAIPFTTMDGATASLADYVGQVVLVVNVASKCGLTPQYEGLQALYAELAASGLVVLGFPANDFMGQEPGTDAEIADFCSLTYAVTFPVMSKISVVGPEQHPLYAALTAQAPAVADKDSFREVLRGHGGTPTEDPDVLWNFEKFLIGRDGAIAGRFAPQTMPDAEELRSAIDTELAK